MATAKEPSQLLWQKVGCYADIIASVILNHAPTKQAMEWYKRCMQMFCDKMKGGEGEVEILQTGSSYDGLSLTFLLEDPKTGEMCFVPETDFDFMIVHCTYPLGDRTASKVPEMKGVDDYEKKITLAADGCDSQFHGGSEGPIAVEGVGEMKKKGKLDSSLISDKLETLTLDPTSNPETPHRSNNKDDTSLRSHDQQESFTTPETDTKSNVVIDTQEDPNNNNKSFSTIDSTEASIHAESRPETEEKAPELVSVKTEDTSAQPGTKLHSQGILCDATSSNVPGQGICPNLKQDFDTRLVHRDDARIFAEMQPSKFTGYILLNISRDGRIMLEEQARRKPQVREIIKHLTPGGLIPNTVFLAADIHKVLRYDQSGPALSDFSPLERHKYSFDYVLAFPCASWPSAAQQWLVRTRKWPQIEVVEEIKKAGCHAVPVGYYTSSTKDLEWRLSLNAAERILSKALSPCQRKCYVITKLLVKHYLPKECILSSYHLKNLLFWLCEEHPPDEWQDNNLGLWIRHLLHYVDVSLAAHNIANYFLSDQNMIQHRTSDEVRNTLECVRRLIEHPMTCLESTCQSLHLYTYEQRIGSKHTGEKRSAVLVYIALAQLLKKSAVDGIGNKEAVQRFKSLVRLNDHAPEEITRSGIFYTACDLLGLLWPLAEAFIQQGDTDKAIWLYNVLLKEERDTTLQKHPDVMSNLACAYNVKSQRVADSDLKSEYTAMAISYFEEALVVSNSPGIHFTYGSFLLDGGFLDEAQMHLDMATNLDCSGSDNHVFLNIEIPGDDGSTIASTVSIPIAIASLYMLVQCLQAKKEEIVALKVAEGLEELSKTVSLREQSSCLFLCAQAYKLVGKEDKATMMLAMKKDVEDIMKDVR